MSSPKSTRRGKKLAPSTTPGNPGRSGPSAPMERDCLPDGAVSGVLHLGVGSCGAVCVRRIAEAAPVSGVRGDELVGVASLAADVAEQNINFLAAATSDYCEFFSHPDYRRQLVDAVLAELHANGVESLAMARIP